MRTRGATLYLPALVRHPDIDVAMVVWCRHVVANRWKRVRRRLRKIRRIGVTGVLTGLYMRGWDRPFATEDLYAVAGRLGVRVEETPRLGCERTRSLFRDSGADLGVALGTTIVPASLFTIPPHGMINVHGDVLPRFRGGRSVVWPIYEGIQEAGFTIHRLDRGIDTGAILHVERFPIELRPTLRETYEVNVRTIRRLAPDALANVLADFPRYLAESREQTSGDGTTYTTPTLRQFLVMRRQHRKMLREASIRPMPETKA